MHSTWSTIRCYEESSGSSIQAGILEPHLQLSLDTLHLDANGDPACGLPRTALSFGFITPAPCVVVDYFADSLWTTRGGDPDGRVNVGFG